MDVKYYALCTKVVNTDDMIIFSFRPALHTKHGKKTKFHM